jgi:hypothetical protein
MVAAYILLCILSFGGFIALKKMQGGKKKVTNKETSWNHGKSSRSKAVVEYREDKVEGKVHLLTGCNAIFFS